LLLEKPHLQPYFYGQKTFEENLCGNDTSQLAAEIEMMCEILAGLLEHASLQRPNISNDAGQNCWWTYTRERFQKSHVFRKYFDANRHCYTKQFRETVSNIFQTRQGHVSGFQNLSSVSAVCIDQNLTKEGCQTVG
jgi:hypothetical protein